MNEKKHLREAEVTEEMNSLNTFKTEWFVGREFLHFFYRLIGESKIMSIYILQRRIFLSSLCF